MTGRKPAPGVSREERISDTGLQRLEQHLQHGAKISRPVLAQWVKRYGEPAKTLLRKYGQYSSDLD